MKKVLFMLFMITAGMLPLAAQMDSSLTEDWESGDFTGLAWERPGTQYRWEVTSEGAHSGRYCARSGNYYTLNTESVLQLGVYFTDAGTLSYYRKVFSAEGSGGFLFWLDGELRDSLAGYVDWSEFQCPIELYIRPNPAEDYLILETDSDVPLWVEIYDIRGILVMKSLCTCPARLDITHLNAGVYFLQATHSDGHREVVKIVKK